MRIASLPASLPGRALGGLLLVLALVAMTLMLLGVVDAISAGVAAGADVRLAPFRWEPLSGRA